jgi:ATP-dependent protease Clp ATPase subunit
VTELARCTFCEKSRSEVGRLIAAGVPLICDDCIGLAAAFVDDRFARDPETRVRRGEPKLMREPCELCRDLIARCQFTSYGHVICDVCVDLCVDILAET